MRDGDGCEGGLNSVIIIHRPSGAGAFLASILPDDGGPLGMVDLSAKGSAHDLVVKGYLWRSGWLVDDTSRGYGEVGVHCFPGRDEGDEGHGFCFWGF